LCIFSSVGGQREVLVAILMFLEVIHGSNSFNAEYNQIRIKLIK
jgi:hypothetical protein